MTGDLPVFISRTLNQKRLFILARFTGRYVEDGPLYVADNDGTVLDAGRDTGGKTPVDDVFLVIDSNLNLRAEVLNIIVIKAEKAQHLVKVMGMGFAELYFLTSAGEYPLGFGIKLRARHGIAVNLDHRLDYLGVVLHAVRRVFSVRFGIIYNVFSVFTLMHFNYLFLKM
jgi:hypothetical protein